MKKVYGYIRVSTVKQGTGVSLQEQKEAIVRYAEKHDLNIVEWFEELETAAKQGRPLFTKMMKLLRTGKSAGVIIHKIDRSARNLKDWAALGDLIDEGVDVHFAHESLDMDTRGGRLAADIQAVIASDYIRNLREEAIKGLYGRLKQGIYPFGAPIGYDNKGGGQVKPINPIQGPLVKKAFQLYASGKYTLEALTKVMNELGLRNSNGNILTLNSLSLILNNPFYAGVIKVKGKTFQGKHDPLIHPELFAKTQNILRGKTNTRLLKHDFLFRRLIKCADCCYSLIGEKQKGHVYYRCQTKGCPTKTVREELIEKAVIKTIEEIQLHAVEEKVLNELLHDAQVKWTSNHDEVEESLKMQQSKISQKLERLTDAFIDNVIDKNQFENKKEKLLVALQGFKHKSMSLSDQKEAIFKKASKFLELVKSSKKSYLNGINEEKRKIIKSVTSNFAIQGRKLMITMKSPFYEIANRIDFLSGALDRNTPRTCTPENASTAINGDNSENQKIFVANLAIDPETKQVDFSHSVPIQSYLANPDMVKENMQQLLDMILGFFEVEAQKVESGELKEEQMLLELNDLQPDDTNTKRSIRQLPEGFDRRRA
ncbi:MAG TPA: recombinase family protein [Saprospiraceae bacterium]|nr:recombinase family protein [Saprospiraceae bacterium]